MTKLKPRISSLSTSRDRSMNHARRSPLQIIGRRFPLSQRERAGVRENRSNGNVMRFIGRSGSSFALCLLILIASVFTVSALAEMPGEFRPQPVLHPTEKCGATGDVVEP